MLHNLKQLEKNKLSGAIKVAVATAMISGLLLTTVQAADPDQIQIEDDNNALSTNPNIEAYKQGAFDLQAESSSIVSAATEGVMGHYPGIRTIATVNNIDGLVRICSTVTAHYQIIDIDGDWDLLAQYRNTVVTDGDTTYTHMKTSDTIVWYITDGISAPVAIPDSMINSGVVSENHLSIKVPTEIDLNDGKGLRSTKGMELQYRITPWTMIGSIPRTVGELPGQGFLLDETAVNNGELPVVVSNLAVGRYLPPDSFTGSQAIDAQNSQISSPITQGAFTFPGMPAPTGNNSFITAAVIGDADPADCDGFKPGVKVKILDKNGLDILDSNKPTLWVTNEYKAVIEITDSNGVVRSLTKEELENSEVPFTWNIYYRKNASQSCDFNPLENPLSVTETNECFIKETFAKGDPRITIETDDTTGALKSSVLRMQATNADAKVQLPPNYSEQGYFVTVSFGYDDAK